VSLVHGVISFYRNRKHLWDVLL